jgi:RimJ/RimL family protein N-acetyltransferase
VITFDAEGPEESVDALWRLALAVEAACVIREEDGARQVDLLLEGRRARLALALAQRPWPRRSDLAGVFRRLLRRARDERLLILARDLRDGPPSVKPNVAVEFTEATEAEVRRHPRRFGLRLSATAPRLPGARQFVGRLHGRAVYRMVCTPAPPVLEHLDRAMLDRLAAPRALVSDCYTDPQWRGESIYPAALQWLARWAAERDIRTLVLLVRADNEASIRGAKKAGFELRGEASSSAR